MPGAIGIVAKDVSCAFCKNAEPQPGVEAEAEGVIYEFCWLHLKPFAEARRNSPRNGGSLATAP